jgi:hypothetical protein
MSIFINGVHAINCGGSFYTEYEDTHFTDCIAENCVGFGFMDMSGMRMQKLLPDPKKGFAEGIEYFKQVAEESKNLRANRTEIHRALDMLNVQVQSNQPDKNVIGLWFQRIEELSKEHGNEDKAREIFLFGSSIEWYLRKMRAYRIL